MSSAAFHHLDIFANPEPGRDYLVQIRIPEFTCLCPKTGQPDFATIVLEYVPESLCVELKSLKLYVHAWRDVGTFHEALTCQILDDLETLLHPRWIRIAAHFHVRGGITTNVFAEQKNKAVQLPLASSPTAGSDSLAAGVMP
jgi:7-cyano-7-deazaguanine reductase